MKLLNESGRSILEMLGVLAIIGVLTIVGIAGYRAAILRLRTNELIDESNRRAISISSQLSNGITPTLGDFRNNRISGDMEFSTEVITDQFEGQFGITISNIPYEICENLLEVATQELPTFRALSNPLKPNIAIRTCAEGNNSYVLIFNNDLDTTEFISACDSGFKEIQMCNGIRKKCCEDNGNVCKNQQELATCCESNTTCKLKGQTCLDGVCRCPEGQFYGKISNKTGCQDCSNTNRATNVTWHECSLCGDTRHFQGSSLSSGTCDPVCPDGWFQNSNNGNCTSCANMTTAGKQATEEECKRCDKTPFKRTHKNGYCLPPAECPDGYYKDTEKTMCRSCNDMTAYKSGDDCQTKCPGRIRVGGYCQPPCESGTFRNPATNECIPCSDLNTYQITEDVCNQCQNTAHPRVFENQKCYPIPAQCAQDEFRTTTGRCVPCEEANESFKPEVADESECNRCPNRIYNELNGHKYCGLCPSGQYYELSQTKMQCVSCTKARTTTEKACTACSDRIYIGTTCRESCTGPDEFMSNSGECFPCSKREAVSTIPTQCAICNEGENKRKMNDADKCVIDGCKEDEFQDSSDNCVSCGKIGAIASNKEQCDKCFPNRYWALNQGVYHCLMCEADSVMEVNTSKGWHSCRGCNWEGGLTSIKASCDNCSNRVFHDVNGEGNLGTCYPCDSLDVLTLTQEECNRCSTTERTYLGNNKCGLKTCPSDTFKNSSGACVSCNLKNNQNSTKNDCDSCGAKRSWNGTQCVWSNISDYFLVGNEWRQCDHWEAVEITQEACSVCANKRTWTGGKCVWNGGKSGWFQNKNLNWTQCENPDSKEPISAESCLSCNTTENKRHMDGNLCVLGTS